MTDAAEAIRPRRRELSEGERRLNRIVRVIGLIEGNARLATPGPWSMDHGQVVKRDHATDADGRLVDKSFDIACQPWEKRMTVRGLHPGKETGDMRHIATCDPRTMLQLVADVRELLAERAADVVEAPDATSP